MLNYNHLYYFYVTARTGGVTAAAEILKIAQPSLSAQIKTLESAVERALFQKVGRRIELTQDGEYVYGFCRRIFEPAEELEQSLLSGRRLHNPRVHLGICDEVERPFMVEVTGRILSQFHKDTSPRLIMTSGDHTSMVLRLKNRLVDALITNQPVLDDSITSVSRYSMPVAVVCHPSYLGRRGRSSSRHSSELKRIATEVGVKWILPHRRLRLRTETDAFLEKLGVPVNVVFESDVVASLVRAVLEGIGVALLPLPYVDSYVRQDRLIAMGPSAGFWTHGVWLYVPKGMKETAVTQALKSSLARSMAARLSPA